ncbi:hypothetical protein, partial [uncultured Microbulbifer sp.]|uniref:hypothetical protein n=1 Tax=uncultured Microbulbifer sp. TaxID=348147 RepID=UPI00260734AF
DGSVGFPHVRVGHRQAYIPKGPPNRVALFLCLKKICNKKSQEEKQKRKTEAETKKRKVQKIKTNKKIKQTTP